MYCIVVYGLGVELTSTICWDNIPAQLSQTNKSTTTNASATIITTTTTITITTTTTSTTAKATSTKNIIVKDDNQTCTQ